MKTYNTLDLIEALSAIGTIILDGDRVDSSERYDKGWQLRVDEDTTPKISWAIPDQYIELSEDAVVNEFKIKNSAGQTLRLKVEVRRWITTYDLDAHIAFSFEQR